MSWSIQTTGMLKINCVADAARAWEAAKPWRDVDNNIRPLADRRKKHIAIVKLGDDRGFACRLFKTDVVTYYSDGDIALRCHDTQSTAAFAWRVAPRGCSTTSFKGQMYWECATPEGARFYRQGREPLQLTPAGDSWQLLSVPHQPVEWRYSPKAGAAVRKRLKPYKLWYDVTKKLGALPRVAAWTDKQRVSAVWENLACKDVAFSEILAFAGTPDEILPYAYQLGKARYKTFAPHDRLPRNSA